ncbi:MAG: alpha/beta hydrolase family protein [Candidatus Saccharibacteria bacterium]
MPLVPRRLPTRMLFALSLVLPGAFLAASAAIAGAAQAASPLPLTDFTRFGNIGNPSISPDGHLLAVSVRTPGKDANSRSSYQLAVLHLPDLKPVSRLDMAPHNLPARIVWVSDKRLVVAVAFESAWLDVPQLTGEIVAVDYDGSHKTTLYDLSKRGSSLHSQDMPRGFATIAGVPEPRKGHIYLDLSPESNGNYTVYEAASSMVYDVDSANGKAVEIGKIDRGGMSFVVHDGIARYAYGSPDDGVTLETWTRDGKDRPWRKLTVGGQLRPLRLSADGKTLWSLYSADGGPEGLAASKPDGNGLTMLASDDFASVQDVLFAPHDGAPYAAAIGGGRPRFIYLDDTPLAQIHQALAGKFPDEFIDVAGYSDDGSTLLIHAESDRDPGTYALFERAKMNLRPLFQVESWIEPARMAARQPVRFKASDGQELGGFLTLPTHGNKPYPTVLLPHGGPIGVADQWFYDPDAQFLASRGYAVLQVNYRGSAGRGPAFEHAGYKHFGDRIQQDLIDGVRWAVARGDSDTKRICVYGGSFGGYSSLMTPILAPNLFKCAIDYAGVSDWTIGMDSSDTSHYAAGLRYFAAAIGDKAAARAISPLYMLDRFNVPVLIAHGEDDPRVPYRNATALRAALDKAGKPYVWLSKPKEGHGFYTEQDRTDLYQHMQDFLQKNLGQ